MSTLSYMYIHSVLYATAITGLVLSYKNEFSDLFSEVYRVLNVGGKSIFYANIDLLYCFSLLNHITLNIFGTRRLLSRHYAGL